MELKEIYIGEPTFENIINENCLYVDKTNIIHTLVKRNKYVFLSRPRRFGKSLLISTLKAYFEGKKDLFKGTVMEQLETEWKQHPVFHFDFSDIKTPAPDFVNERIEATLEFYEELYNIQPKRRETTQRLITLVQHATKETKQPAVLLIDEYDAPMLNAIYLDKETKDAVRLVMQQFYSPIKRLAPYWKFVMLTGITKFSQLGIFSQLNNLSDISMLADYDAICGITKEELLTDLRPYVENLATAYEKSYNDMLADLKHWYDGYHFGDGQHDIYNPYSLLKALHFKKLDYYWYPSGTGEYLIKLLQRFSIDLLAFSDDCTLTSNMFDAEPIDNVSCIPMLYQAGYLTVKKYNREYNDYNIGIPNHEVKVGMMENLLPAILGEQFTSTSNTCISNAYTALVRDNFDGFMTNIQAFFANISYENYKGLGLQNMLNHEQFFHTLFYVALSFMNISVRTEVKTPDGSVDAIAHTRNRVYIFEFKLNGTADQALAQIHEKKYYDSVKHLPKEIWLIGVEFGKETKRIDNWKIEKMN